MLKVFDDNNNQIGLLENLKDFYIIRKLNNGEVTLSFSLYNSDPFCDLIKEECYIETKEGRYIVKNINNQATVSRYSCILDLEGLVRHLHLYGFSCRQKTLSDTLTLILEGSDWRFEITKPVDGKKSFTSESEDSYNILLDLVSHWGLEIQFDSQNKIVRVAEELGEDKGVYFTDELNLTAFNVESDTNDFATRLYPRGKDNLTIASVNGGKEYIEDFTYSTKVIPLIWTDERYEVPENLLEAGYEKLRELATPKNSYELEIVDLAKLNPEYDFLKYSIGDTVTLLSSAKKMRLKHRIVELTEYPLEPALNKVTLANCVVTMQEVTDELKEKFEGSIKVIKREFKETTKGLETSVAELTNGLEIAKSQIVQNADEIKLVVKKSELSTQIQQCSDAVNIAINNGQGSNGINVTEEGLSVFRNKIRSILFNEGKMHIYNSLTGQYMGYYGTVGNDLRVQLYGANTFSIFAGEENLNILSVIANKLLGYGNATLNICGGINLTQRPGQDVGDNGLALGNDDRSDRYGYHNLFIKCHNSMGIADNNGLTNGFYDARRGRWVLKGGLYQNTETPPGTYILSMDEAHPFFCGRKSTDIVRSILNLETSIKVDDEDDLTMVILPNEDELMMSYIGGKPHIDQSSIIAGLVEVVKSQQKQINQLLEREERVSDNDVSS